MGLGRLCTRKRGWSASSYSPLLALSLLACGGKQVEVGYSRTAVTEPPSPATASSSNAPTPTGAEAQVNEPRPPDAATLRAAVSKTGESEAIPDSLGLRFEVLPRPAGEPWLGVIVNRGTETVNVTFELAALTLSLEKPAGEKKKWERAKAPVVCRLPEAFAAADLDRDPLQIAPGEGLVRVFDPRLYCFSSAGNSLLATGLTVTTKLGYTPKPPRALWKAGKRIELPVPQSAPFLATPATTQGDALGEPVTSQANAELIEPRVKQLTAVPFVLDAALVGEPAANADQNPLRLELLHGSDAGDAATATVTLRVRNAGGKRAYVYFRREFVSFEVHGPDGVRVCDPQPDERAPDRQAFSQLALGGAVSATSLLVELCPDGTFARPGLYLLHATFESERDGAEYGLDAFTGHLDSHREALVRVRRGELPPLPAPAPIRVRVGD